MKNLTILTFMIFLSCKEIKSPQDSLPSSMEVSKNQKLDSAKLFNHEDCNEGKIAIWIKSFYHQYIPMNINAGQSTIDSFLKLYCTEHLISKIKKLELDYDPFTYSQDASLEVLDTLKVNKISEYECLFEVCYIDNYSKKNVCIRFLVNNVQGRFYFSDIII